MKTFAQQAQCWKILHIFWNWRGGGGRKGGRVGGRRDGRTDGWRTDERKDGGSGGGENGGRDREEDKGGEESRNNHSKEFLPSTSTYQHLQNRTCMEKKHANI